MALRPGQVALVAIVSVAVVVASGATAARQAAAKSTTTTTSATAPRVDSLTMTQVITRTTADLRSFWSDAFPQAFGKPYVDVAAVRGYDSTMISGSVVSVCARGATYEELRDNAFYCSLDDVVAYDAEHLMPGLFRRYGGIAVALVLAHEWGHAIQARTLTEAQYEATSTVLLETQADCYTGAWAGHLRAPQTGATLRVVAKDLDQGVAGLIHVSDPVGLVDPSQEGAHGSAFDRAGAFEEGVVGGVSRCARWLADPPAITETPFTNVYDLATGGNASYADAVKTATTTLRVYWSATSGAASLPKNTVAYDSTKKSTLKRCKALGLDPKKPSAYKKRIYYCPNDRTVHYDQVLTHHAYDLIGDFAVAVLLAHGWSDAVVKAAGTGSGPGGTRHDCLDGAWAGSLPVARADGTTVAAHGGAVRYDYGTTTLSAGDLDEIVQSFLLLAEPSPTKTTATAFDRLAAFRTGFLAADPLTACSA